RRLQHARDRGAPGRVRGDGVPGPAAGPAVAGDPARRRRGMTPDQYERLWRLFEEAQACDPAGRATLLDARCGDPRLRAEVGKLLARADAAPTADFPGG